MSASLYYARTLGATVCHLTQPRRISGGSLCVKVCQLRDGLGEVFWLLLQTHLLSLFPPFWETSTFTISAIVLLEKTDLNLCLI